MFQLIKISRNPSSHLFIYVPKNEAIHDKIIDPLLELIECPFIGISMEGLKPTINKIASFKGTYNNIKANHSEDSVDEDDPTMQEMLETLHITDFSKIFLQNLVFIDDCADNKEVVKQSELLSLVTEARYHWFLFRFAV